MEILKFEDFNKDTLNSSVIKENSYIKREYEGGLVYEHTLQFVLPYHLNKIVKQGKEKRIRSSAFTVKNDVLLFDDFSSKAGGLGSGYLRRSSVMSAYVYKGKININSDKFTDDWFESLRENIPFYRLIYTTIKNGNKMYSEKGLEKLKEEFPEYVFE